jgi:uncharacterized protein (TIGR00369 family)
MVDPPGTWQGSFGERLGLRYDEVEPGRARAALEIRPEHLNPTGFCHGGVLFTCADDALGGAVYGLTPEGHHPTSNQINIHITRSVQVGDRLTVESRALSYGRRTALLEARVTDAQGRLVALATATCLFVEDR